MMTARERVLAALARHEPDAVPADYFGAPEIERQLRSHQREGHRAYGGAHRKATTGQSRRLHGIHSAMTPG